MYVFIFQKHFNSNIEKLGYNPYMVCCLTNKKFFYIFLKNNISTNNVKIQIAILNKIIKPETIERILVFKKL